MPALIMDPISQRPNAAVQHVKLTIAVASKSSRTRNHGLCAGSHVRRPSTTKLSFRFLDPGSKQASKAEQNLMYLVLLGRSLRQSSFLYQLHLLGIQGMSVNLGTCARRSMLLLMRIPKDTKRYRGPSTA